MKIYLFGASNPETCRMIKDINNNPGCSGCFMGFLDNDIKKHYTTFYGFPVFGGIEKVKSLAGPNVGFINLITRDTKTRYEVSKDIIDNGGQLVNFIHSSVNLNMVKLGCGIYLQESVIVQADVEIGDNSSIHIGSLIGHETKIGESVFIAHGVSISGCCEIGDGVLIGTNATILPRIKIGKWATVGAGAVVIRDVPDYAVVVGNPAKIIKYNQR